MGQEWKGLFVCFLTSCTLTPENLNMPIVFYTCNILSYLMLFTSHVGSGLEEQGLQARDCSRWPNLACVSLYLFCVNVFIFLVNVYFCCDMISLISSKPRYWLGEITLTSTIACFVSTSQSVPAVVFSDTRPFTCNDYGRQFAARIGFVGLMRIHKKWRETGAHISFRRETPSSSIFKP